jgi:hypothetical protein
MANMMESSYTTGSRDASNQPLNLRAYRAPQRPGSRARKILYFAAPVAAGLLAWRYKRLRPIMTSLAMSGLAYSTNQWRVSRRQGKLDRRIDEASAHSFPASDAPSY